MEIKRKIRIAFITIYGLSVGGTERFLQTIASNLPKDEFEIDYYYTGEVAEHRKNYVIDNGVNCIHYDGEYNSRYRYISLRHSNFEQVFKDDYDLIFTGRCGLPQDPFPHIRTIPIIDTLHYISGVDNQYNIARVLHISNFSRDKWIAKGGDKQRVEMISLPLYLPPFTFKDIRSSLGLREDVFLFGFHQANRDEIFSEIPLKAYKEIECENNAFVICNGSRLYREQAKDLELKNVFFYDYVKDDDEFYSIIKSLNVYAHGRKDGELNSAAIAEALSFGLPIITHPSAFFNGHLEIVKGNGFVANNYLEYAKDMKILEEDRNLRENMGQKSLVIFKERYSFDAQMSRIRNIIYEVLHNPYPHKKRRILFDFKQRCKNSLLKTLKLVLNPENP
ncbi:glycosyltransferase, group 1 family protein [Oribacterium parvum ACB8]|jgi:glycosyltransferase family 1|uniref:glycosyltransferase n=1 Tax=Oribacterium parvum TaxID=1501329 RepID=UPI00026F08A3|nr:glycosyltransferase [Oribacterium parvum]EJF12183.1 glycosyltransferase, group 1 family protein [Oribacterium parvum ACB8]